MKKILLSLGLAWMVLLSVEARPKENWSKGEIKLATGECLRGELLYAPEVEVVSIRFSDGRHLAFGTRQVTSFAFWDIKNQQTRSFVMGHLHSGREVIFENVADGALKIQRRFKPYSRKKIFTFTAGASDGFPQTAQEHGRFEYFITENELPMPIEQFLRKRYSTVTKHWKKELDNYRFINDLDNGVASWLQVLVYFNLLETKQNPTEYDGRQTPATTVQTMSTIH